MAVHILTGNSLYAVRRDAASPVGIRGPRAHRSTRRQRHCILRWECWMETFSLARSRVPVETSRSDGRADAVKISHFAPLGVRLSPERLRGSVPLSSPHYRPWS